MIRVGAWCFALALPAWATACTCGDNSMEGFDAGKRDAPTATDALPRDDGAVPLTFVDIAIGGCVTTDAGAAGCEGQSPLRLQFSAIAPSPIQVYLWDFGDGAVSNAAAPEHTYTTPGLYTIALDVEGPGGALGVSSPDAVSVSGGALGVPCSADGQCDSGLCVCDPTDGECPAGLSGRGVCAADCEASACLEGNCVDLAPAGPASPEDWQRSLCLPACDGGCPTGLACRSLLDDTGAWTAACFAPLVGSDLGGSCVDATGAPDNDRCTSGLCLDVGARGMCGFDCSSEACPSEAACATFNGPIGLSCLADCAQAACDSDPWLACEPPGNGGALGFTIAGAPSMDGYCAPQFCADAPMTDCAPDGQCTNGHCGP